MRALFMRSSRAAPLKLIAGAIAAISIVGVAQAATVYDTSLVDPPGFYNGTGQPNTGFTVNSDSGAELGLGVLYRYGPAVHPAAGTSTYGVSTGLYSAPPTTSYCYLTCSLWNIQYSVNLRPGGENSNSNVLSIYSYVLDVSDTHGHSVSFNPLTTFLDNAGWDGSENVAYDGASIDNRSTDWGFQNSENLSFGEFSGLNFDPLANETYTVTLSLLDSTGTPLGSVTEIINATPIPAALPQFASGLGVVGFAAHRRKRKKASAAA
jgi:hypothetical protein